MIALASMVPVGTGWSGLIGALVLFVCFYLWRRRR
jgi:hypothetical protein